MFGSLKGKEPPPKPLVDPGIDELKTAVNELRQENADLRETVRKQSKGLYDLQGMIEKRFTDFTNEMINMHKNLRGVAESETQTVTQLQAHQDMRLEKLMALTSQLKDLG